MHTSGNDRLKLGLRGGRGAWRKVIGMGVVCVFAAMWAWMGAGALPYGAGAIRVAAIVISIAMLTLHALAARTAPVTPVDRRLITLAIVGELVALWVMGAILDKIQRNDLLLPGLAVVVGLHFYPMARALRISAYAGAATAMIIVGVVSLAFPETARTGFVGLGCAAILWITLALSLRFGDK